MEQDKLLEALSVIALHNLVSYIDLDGNPVVCDWEAYVGSQENEYNRYWLTEEQFYIVKEYLEKTFKGKL